MKFIHVSDLHLGKRVNEFSMIEDQKYILQQIADIIRQEQVQGVILAGDIYDRAVPTAEAVQLFDSFLTGLADCGLSVFIISGNHDSAERLAFGARLMTKQKVYISPLYTGEEQPIILRDAYGELRVYLLPFVKPATVRHALECGSRQAQVQSDRTAEAACNEAAAAREEEAIGSCQDTETEAIGSGQDAVTEAIGSYQDAVAAAVSRMKPDPEKRNVLVAHQFVTGAARCESEEITVGGLDNVDASVFDGFDYVALGHLHSPQHVGRETVRYCGTPLKYSFSEAGQEKTVTLVELKQKGEVALSTVVLHPLRDMRKIRGTYLEVTAKPFYENTNRMDYVQITLTDEEDIPDGMQKLRILYPNLMRLEYDNRRTRENRLVEAAGEEPQKSEAAWFAEFFELQNNRPMSREQLAFSEQLIQKIRE